MSKKYQIRAETMEGITFETAFNLNGDYIGDLERAQYLCDQLGIAPELAKPEASVCSIGFSESKQKWYGWSHRAIFGFGIGDSVKKGDCAYVAGTPEELIESHVNFMACDIMYPDPVRRKAKAEELRAQCAVLPHGRGIVINDPGIRTEAVILGSMDDIANVITNLEISDQIKPEPVQLLPAHQRVVLCGRGEWTAKTLEDARQMAIDFAESVG